MSVLLDLLDAITEIRIKNPDLRQTVLAAFRLAGSEGLISAGRLYTLGTDGGIQSIFTHGPSSLDEDSDRSLITACQGEDRSPRQHGKVQVLPLGKSKRLFGVLFLEGVHSDDVGPFLAELMLQWCAVAEYTNTQKAELLDENYHLREELRLQFSERGIIGVSGGFRRVMESARRVAASTATVLLYGETGTGKELIARMIHQHSPRANAPFVTVNCGALSESLLESELFGHIKGAFTGATADRKGRFEAAHGGTIFLDEIGEISPAMQVRLLRVLQEMEIVRVGEHQARKLDVRVVAATNRNLEQEVAKGSFRADLFYRLNVVYLAIPPLRQRPEDIPPLVEHFLSVYCQRNCKYIDSIHRDVLEIMKSYPWPGNVRELENCIEKMVVMAPAKELTTDLLPMALMAYNPHVEAEKTVSGATFEQMLKHQLHSETAVALQAGREDLYDTVRAKWERHLFEAVLDACKNNKSKAAKLLGITRNTLATRLGELSNISRQWNVE